jgi:tRNA threonylcarbamoyladenosine biosynthesis protein TsaE
MLVRTHSEEETIALGRSLAREWKRGVVLLIGNLGSGKTTLTKGIAEGLGVLAREEVSSPTFSLIHEYGPTLYHIDLYRLDTEAEVATLGLEELFDQDALIVIEWGERFSRLMPDSRMEVRFRTISEEEREIEVRQVPQH